MCVLFRRVFHLITVGLHLVSCLFFFFKQKTAYEMRISDWSSDVCSSDLGAGREPRPGAAAACALALGGRAVDDRACRARGLAHASDRKSVVEGKSVSVRVDLGGRRIIKKKKEQTIIMQE